MSSATPTRQQGTPLPARLLLALGGGVLLWLAFPTTGLWYAAWLGCALLAAASWAARAGTGFLVGLFGGLAFFVPTLSWSGVYVGRLPWAALATLEALYIALMVAVVGALQRRLLTAGRGWAAYLLIPLGWMVGEWARSTTPFGGFPWARLAFSQADAPIRALAMLGGAPLLTAGVAAIGALLLAGFRAAVAHRIRRSAVTALTLAALVAVVWAIPLPATSGEHARIGLVQGNVPHPGLDFNAERRAVLDNHVAVTTQLAATERAPMDLVVWPENASDIDPLRNSDAAARIVDALQSVGGPLLVGAILNEPAPYFSNVSLLYRPGRAEPERYAKQHPVPFAEYVPYKDFFRHFNDKVDLVRNGMAAGDRTGYFELTTRDGRPFAVLPSICFEVAYDALVRDSVQQNPGRPSVLVVQTNNATFGYTAESEQQYAISRIRAIEHGRAVVHVSTVGVSGFIAPDGSGAPQSRLFTPYAAAQDVPLRTGLTPAARLGALPEYAALAGLLLAASFGRRVRPVTLAPTPSRRPKELAGA